MDRKIVLIVFALAWIAFTLWTIKMLWKSSDDPKEALFLAEFKLLALGATIGSAFLLPEIGEIPGLSYWNQVFLWGFLLFPGSVWAMHLGARLFHKIIEPD